MVLENITHLPASPPQLEIYRKAQRDNSACTLILQYRRDGWPGKSSLIKPYWEAWTVGDGLLLFDSRIVIPESF